MADTIDTAMILAAGFGKRLRPITETTPKPLVPVGGRTMLDRALDTAAAAGIGRAVINIHWLGEQIIDHCALRTDIDCIISDERAEILETGGGIVKALPLLGNTPFAVLNADTFWIDGPERTLAAMIQEFDTRAMDMLLLLCSVQQTTGHGGGTDFLMDKNSVLSRANGATAGLVYAGAAIINPAIFYGARAEPHSLNRYFDTAIAAGRLYGQALKDGHWITVGTPEGLAQAEAKLAQLSAD